MMEVGEMITNGNGNNKIANINNSSGGKETSSQSQSPSNPTPLKKPPSLDNERKRQSMMSHWKYKATPSTQSNTSTTTLNVSSDEISNSMNDQDYSQQNLYIHNIPTSGEGGEGYNKSRRNSAPSMRTMVSHWKFDPKGIVRQQRQLQLIGEHQQLMYLKRLQESRQQDTSSHHIPITTSSQPTASMSDQIHESSSPPSLSSSAPSSSSFTKSTFHPYTRPSTTTAKGSGSPRSLNITTQTEPQPRMERRYSLPSVPNLNSSSPTSTSSLYSQYHPTLQPPSPKLTPKAQLSTSSSSYLDSIPENQENGYTNINVSTFSPSSSASSTSPFLGHSPPLYINNSNNNCGLSPSLTGLSNSLPHQLYITCNTSSSSNAYLGKPLSSSSSHPLPTTPPSCKTTPRDFTEYLNNTNIPLSSSSSITNVHLKSPFLSSSQPSTPHFPPKTPDFHSTSSTTLSSDNSELTLPPMRSLLSDLQITESNNNNKSNNNNNSGNINSNTANPSSITTTVSPISSSPSTPSKMCIINLVQ